MSASAIGVTAPASGPNDRIIGTSVLTCTDVLRRDDVPSALSDRLSRLVKTMRGSARITDENVQDMLREVRMALLEADVALPVVRDFIARVKDRALGAEVSGSLSPGQAFVGVVDRELAATMGPTAEASPSST